MIFDNVDNLSKYEGIGWLTRALELRGRFSDPSVEPGAHPVDDSLRAAVNRYTSAPAEKDRFENHRDWIDVQFMVSGSEEIRVCSASDLVIAKPYDPAADYELGEPASGAFSSVILRPGDFLVLWPGEAHYPGIAPSSPAPVSKIVFKVRA